MSEPGTSKGGGGEPGTFFHGHSGVQLCGDWCRHFVPLDENRWDGFGRCVHPLSLRNGQVFSVAHDCAVGEAPPASG